jgi:hypothetical protein
MVEQQFVLGKHQDSVECSGILTLLLDGVQSKSEASTAAAAKHP